jgi:uncharacterized protein (TIGR03382 family)
VTSGGTAEICDGLDNDCDGQVDENATCPGSNTCVDGQCAFPCDVGEFPCPFGFFCEATSQGNFCVPDPCTTTQCPAGFDCEPGTGECKDLCAGVTCKTGETCKSGFCLDCFELGCASGEQCVINTDGVGECHPDPCAGVNCGDMAFCKDGACVPLDQCAMVNCEDNEVCDPATGECATSRCMDVGCPQGQACRPSDGQCIPDPCVGVNCPADKRCEVVLDGTASCVGDQTELVTAAGGGCSTSDPETTWLWLFGLAWLFRRRSTRS